MFSQLHFLIVAELKSIIKVMMVGISKHIQQKAIKVNTILFKALFPMI
jgi:hypothetical protein